MNWPNWMKSKIFWGDVLALIIAGVSYAITNKLAPNLTIWLEMTYALLTVIANMIAGTTQSYRLRKAKMQLRACALNK